MIAVPFINYKRSFFHVCSSPTNLENWFLDSLLKEMESHPDEWFRYKLEQYLTKAVMSLSEFLHTGPYDTFFLQNATKGRYLSILSKVVCAQFLFRKLRFTVKRVYKDYP